MPADALPSDEVPDDDRSADDAAGNGDKADADDGSDELVIKVNPELHASLAKLTQRQSEILRRAVEPITSAWAASLSKSMLAGVDTSALQALGKTVAAAIPKFDMPPLIDVSAFKGLQLELPRLLSGVDFTAIRRAIRQGQPPNWHDLGDKVRLTGMLELTDAGLPVAWVSSVGARRAARRRRGRPPGSVRVPTK